VTRTPSAATGSVARNARNSQTHTSGEGGRIKAPADRSNHLRLVRESKPRRRGVSPLLWIGALTVAVALFGLAAFHNFMATAQYDLERLEQELEVEQSRLVDLEYEVEQLNSPAKVESLARGVLGMTDPGEAVDIVVSASVLAEIQTSANDQETTGESSTDWATLKPLLGAS